MPKQLPPQLTPELFRKQKYSCPLSSASRPSISTCLFRSRLRALQLPHPSPRAYFSEDMGDQNKILSRPIFRRDVSWDPFPNWTQPSRIFAQDFGLPPFLDPTDLEWIDWAQKRLASFSWPGYTQTPLLPHTAALQQQKNLRRLTNGVSEIRTGQDSWRISLDVNHFSPEEITITTKEGYLQISGNHEEKQDEHGSVARCFTRKYKLPQGVDLQHISSSLSADGVLSVEAPVPGTTSSSSSSSSPASEIVIPVQVKHKQEGEI